MGFRCLRCSVGDMIYDSLLVREELGVETSLPGSAKYTSRAPHRIRTQTHAANLLTLKLGVHLFRTSVPSIRFFIISYPIHFFVKSFSRGAKESRF